MISAVASEDDAVDAGTMVCTESTVSAEVGSPLFVRVLLLCAAMEKQCNLR